MLAAGMEITEKLAKITIRYCKKLENFGRLQKIAHITQYDSLESLDVDEEYHASLYNSNEKKKETKQ